MLNSNVSDRGSADEDNDPHDEISAPPMQSNASISKGSFLRDLVALKTLMDKRMQQRGLTIFYLTNCKFQNALIYCRQLTFSSMKIYKEYIDEYNNQFEQTYFYRTCKARQHLEYLLDCLIACKVFLQSKKRQDAIDVLEKVEIGPVPTMVSPHDLQQDPKVLFNEKHERMSKMCAVLLSFIEIAKQEKLNDYCQKFFRIYVEYVKSNYGMIQQSTALFKYGSYLYEIKQYTKAAAQFQKCVQLRQKNVVNSCLVDALINLAICQKQLCEYDKAIGNTKRAILFYKDIKIGDANIDKYYLLLAKLSLEAGNFKEAYNNYLKCLKLRLPLDDSSPLKTQIEINLMIFYKVLKDLSEKGREKEKYKDLLNIDDRKLVEEKRREAGHILRDMRITILEREEFSKYRDFKSSKFSHLNLFVTKEFFDSLTSDQVVELNALLGELNDLTFARGVQELHKTSFWQEKKLRDMLENNNKDLKRGQSKKTSDVGSSFTYQ